MDVLIHLEVVVIALIGDGAADHHLVDEVEADDDIRDDEVEDDDEEAGNHFIISFAFKIKIFSISLL